MTRRPLPNPARAHCFPAAALILVPVLLACLTSTILARPTDPAQGGGRLLMQQATPRDADEVFPPVPRRPRRHDRLRLLRSPR